MRSAGLYASRRTLIQGTKEADLGPMELLKRIRLQQVNGMLRSKNSGTPLVSTPSEVARLVSQPRPFR